MKFQRSDENLGGRALASAGFVVFASLIARTSSLIGLAVTGRVLSPEDFGIAALAFSAIALFQTVVDVQAGTYLLAKEEIDRRHIDASFTLQLIRGVILAALVFAGAGPIAAFLETPPLADVLRVLAFVLIVDGFRNPAFLLFERDLDFSRSFNRQTISAVLGLGVSIAAALYFRNYWAIVVATFVHRGAMAALTWWKVPMRPRIGFQEFRSIFSFGSGILAINLVEKVHSLGPETLIAKIISAAAVGQFTMGLRTTNMLLIEVTNPVRQVLLPGFGAIRHDTARFARSLRLAQVIMLGIALPIGLGMSIFANELIYILIGPQWATAAFAIQVLAPFAAVRSIANPVQAAAMASERLRLLFFRALTSMLISWPALYFALKAYGIEGAVFVWAGMMVLGLLLFLQMGRQIAGLSVRLILKDSARTFLSGGLMVGVLYLIHPQIALEGSGVFVFLRTLPFILLGGAIYSAAMLITWHLSGRPAGLEEQVMHYGNGGLKRFRERLKARRAQ